VAEQNTSRTVTAKTPEKPVLHGDEQIIKTAILNGPKDKYITWICQRDKDHGQYGEFANYTEDHLLEDNQKFGTKLAAPYRREGDRLMVGLHWPVFIPIEVHDRREAERVKRDEAMRGKIAEGQRGYEKTLRGRNVLRNIREDHSDRE